MQGGLDTPQYIFHSLKQNYFLVLYMIPKYTLRWRFFRKIGHQFDKNLNISEVRNPKKIEKLKKIASKY